MAEEIMGYKVRKGEDKIKASLAGQVGYYLYGPRGAVYALIRTIDKPLVMFPVNARNGHVCALKGNGWFTDESGKLEVLARG